MKTDNVCAYADLCEALEDLHRQIRRSYTEPCKGKHERPKEILLGLGKSIRRLAHLAYPTAPCQVTEMIAKDQFVEAFDMRLRIQQPRSKSLDAVQLAVGIEAFCSAEHRAESKLITDEEFTHLLEDRSFADYFNIFLALPVFGQRIIYNFFEKVFIYEPPIKENNNQEDKCRVITFLKQRRYPLFRRTTLYIEYLLCCHLRDVEVDFESRTFKEDLEKESHFARNVLGNVLGMQMFRDFIKGTAGENVFRCWIEIQKWKLSDGSLLMKTEMAHNIKMTYLSQGSPCNLNTRGKQLVFEGNIDFEMIHEKDIEEEILAAVSRMDAPYTVDTLDAFDNLQAILLSVLRRYWVPRYFIHLYRTVSPLTLAFLNSGNPFDILGTCTSSQYRKLRGPVSLPGICSAKPNSLGPLSTPKLLSSDTDKSKKYKYSLPNMSTQIPNDAEIPTASSEIILNLKQVASEREKKTGGDEKDEADDARDLEEWDKSSNFLGDSPLHYTIPIYVSSYIVGRRRLNFSRDKNFRSMVVLASDGLAGSPFGQTLQNHGLIKEFRMLEFWGDVRHYLDAEEKYLDPHGTPMKQKLARRLTDEYLTFYDNLEYIFPEHLNMFILQNLNSLDDTTMILYAQDIVLQVLAESWQEYAREDRKLFRINVRNSKRIDRDVIETPQMSAKNFDQTDQTEIMKYGRQESPAKSKAVAMSCARVMVGAQDLTDEHSIKSLEYAILCHEYGRVGMSTLACSTLGDLIGVLYSDYGSLRIKKEPVKRHEFLHNLLNKPKIDIETIKVSRLGILATPEVTALENSQYQAILRRLVIRRRGIVIERPPRPRNLLDILQDPNHYEFFKRFMMSYNITHPLLFWKYVEDLKEAQTARATNKLISTIYRKFFSIGAKQGLLLECNDEILRQISSMERIPPSVLFIAQTSVFQYMERKWFPKYLETYPLDGDIQPPEDTAEPEPSITDLPPIIPREVVPTKKKSRKKKKTLHLWRGFVNLIIEFMKALKDEFEFKLFELYLRREKERDLAKPPEKQKSRVSKPIVSKLVADLNFWKEEQKFKKLVDEIKHQENSTRLGLQLLLKKANTIIDCYLASEVLPHIQINITSEVATYIAFSVTKLGPTRSLFHSAMIQIFPTLYLYWRRFRAEWLRSNDPEAFYRRLKEKLIAPWVASMPHKELKGRDYLQVRESQCEMIPVSQSVDHPYRITFNVMGGIRYMFTNKSMTKQQKVPVILNEPCARKPRSHREPSPVHKIRWEHPATGKHNVIYRDELKKKKSKMFLEEGEGDKNLEQGDGKANAQKKKRNIKSGKAEPRDSAGTKSRWKGQPTVPTSQWKRGFQQLVYKHAEKLGKGRNKVQQSSLPTFDKSLYAAFAAQTKAQLTNNS